jgi:hypothetical protein
MAHSGNPGAVRLRRQSVSHRAHDHQSCMNSGTACGPNDIALTGNWCAKQRQWSDQNERGGSSTRTPLSFDLCGGPSVVVERSGRLR